MRALSCCSFSLSGGDRQADEPFKFGVRKPFDLVDELEALRGALQRSEIRIDALDAGYAGERIAALRLHFALAVPGQEIHHHPGLSGAYGQVHGAADGGNRVLLARAPVGKVPASGNL